MWKYRSPAEQAAAVLGSDNLSGQLPDGQVVTLIDPREALALVKAHGEKREPPAPVNLGRPGPGLVAIDLSLHGGHCFSNGILVCGWPEEHADVGLDLVGGYWTEPGSGR